MRCRPRLRRPRSQRSLLSMTSPFFFIGIPAQHSPKRHLHAFFGCTFNFKGVARPSRSFTWQSWRRKREATQCFSRPLLDFESQAGSCQLNLVSLYKHLGTTATFNVSMFPAASQRSAGCDSAWTALAQRVSSRKRSAVRSKVEVVTMPFWSVFAPQCRHVAGLPRSPRALPRSAAVPSPRACGRARCAHFHSPS